MERRETPRPQKLSRLGYAQANSKNIGGEKGPDKPYWEIRYTEDDEGGGYRFRNPLAEAEYVEYLNYKGGDEDLEVTTNENKKVRGKRRGSGEYDVERRRTLKLLKAEHKKSRRRGPDRQDSPSTVDEYKEEGIRARVRRDELAAQQAIVEGDVILLPEEGYYYDRAIPRDVVYGEWNIDNLGADFDGGGFDDPETQSEYCQYRSDLEYVRQQRLAREMNDRARKSYAKGKVRETFRGEVKR